MLQQAEVKQETPHVCPHTIAFFLDNWVRKIIQNPKRIIGDYVKEGETVVDVGCGPGFFSIDMAKLVGKKGKVIAVDLQEKMLKHVRKKALKHGMAERMDFHQCESDRIGLNRKADFILAVYIVHETPSPLRFFVEIKGLLKDGGYLLVVEPRMHVNQAMFDQMVADAEKAGLRAIDFPKRKGGRSVLIST